MSTFGAALGHSIQAGVKKLASASCRMRRSGMVAVVLAAVVLSTSGRVHAIVVGNQPGVTPATNMNPQDYPGWTEGDPGWDNVTKIGSNFVYLGDGWVLSARHVGYAQANGTTNGVRLQSYNPDGSPGPIKSFFRIDSSYYRDYGYAANSVHTYQYAVSNPTSILNETGQTISLPVGSSSEFTDLQLFRISEDPGLPALNLASAPMPTNYTRVDAPEVVVIGRGLGRSATETHWNTGTPWMETTGPGNKQGYKRVSSPSKNWFGTNRLADIRPNFNGDPGDAEATNFTVDPNKLYESSEVISDSTGVFELHTNGGDRDIISMITVFDKSTSTGNTPLEFQAGAGNSGSSVFYKRNGEWELAGIVHAVSTFEGQPGNTAVYGNATIISDLYYYNQDYFHSISDIINSHPDYSHQGDINLNGTVAGTGTGSTATDDISAFVAGWGHVENELGIGNVESWKKGDLNRDGRTDVQDFLKLRRAFHGEISEAVMVQLFGPSGDPGLPGGVPEPATAVLAALAAAALACRRRR
jgi:hypothetical protein